MNNTFTFQIKNKQTNNTFKTMDNTLLSHGHEAYSVDLLEIAISAIVSYFLLARRDCGSLGGTSGCAQKTEKMAGPQLTPFL